MVERRDPWDAASGPEQVQRVEGFFLMERKGKAMRKRITDAVAGMPLPAVSRRAPIVYFLRLTSGAIYAGCTLDLAQRLEDHASGRAGRTTELDPPVALLRTEPFATFSEARRREAQVKRWSGAKKEALVRNDWETLRALSRSHD